MIWVIVTGEYPPQPGGVSDYTRLVARALAAAGDTVQVWTPPDAAPGGGEDGTTVHRLPDHFGRKSLAALNRAFEPLPDDAQILVQYVPHSYGWKAMNLPFCAWLWTQRKRHRIFVMFHEVAYPWVRHGRVFRHNFLSLVNRLMAGLIARAACQIYMSIPGWSDLLHTLGGGKPVEWLPVPSTMPQTVDQKCVRALRERLLGHQDTPPARALVGHFGTFGAYVSQLLQTIVPSLLASIENAVFLCIGRGAMPFVDALRNEHPALANRLLAVPESTAVDVAEHLAACDLLMQPYPDGISSRRTSTMASLALGRPVLTNRGQLTETIWEESGAVRLVDCPEDMPAQTYALLADPEALIRLGKAGERLYRERFDVSNTVARLRAAAADLHSSSQT